MTARVYREYQRDRVGWFFGLTGLQLGLLAAGALPVAWTVRVGWWAAAFGALVGWAVLLVLVVVPVRGRSIVGWAMASLLFASARLTGRTRWASRLATATTLNADVPDLPAPLDRLQVHCIATTASVTSSNTEGGIAIVQSLTARSWAVVARLDHGGLDWLTDTERDQRVAGLPALLDAACRTGLVSEVQVLVRTSPDDGAARGHWLADHQDAVTPDLARLVHDGLRRHLTQGAVLSETYLILRVPERQLARHARQHIASRSAGQLSSRLAALGALADEVGGHARASLGAGVSWLTSPDLAVACRAGFHPDVHAVIADAAAATQSAADVVDAKVAWAAAGPAHAEARPRSYLHDGWESASVSILLPARGARAGALAPVLHGGAAGERRCLLVGFPVMTATVADRATASREWAADLGDGLRARAGVRPRALTRANQATARGVDAKLVGGAALCRPYAVATTTVPVRLATTHTARAAGGDATSGAGPESSIVSAARGLEASVRQAGFTAQRLDLAHDTAFASGCLPLGHSPAQTSRGGGR